jgi:hypothetical protein
MIGAAARIMSALSDGSTAVASSPLLARLDDVAPGRVPLPREPGCRLRAPARVRANTSSRSS